MTRSARPADTNRTRAIVHLDLDAFFAAVEVLDNDELRDLPILIGGRPGQRGVVATASYKARAYGIHSAMPMARALHLCPDAIVIPPRHKRYSQISVQVMALLCRECERVEQMSIDEAYLDLTGRIARWTEAVDLAGQLQHAVRSQVGLSASLGVGTNKLIAKVASDRDKPGGLTVVSPGTEAAFLAPLPTRVLWGVGPVTAQKLEEIGVTTVGQLAEMPPQQLWASVGRLSQSLTRQAQGIDSRPVVAQHERRSVSQERTFEHDVSDPQILRSQLAQISQGLATHLQRAERVAATIAVKLRYSDFETLTRQTTLSVGTDSPHIIYRTALLLLRRTWQRGRPVRLLGLEGTNLSVPSGQLALC